MLDYELFKKMTVEKLKDFLPDEYKNAKFTLSPVKKINRTLDGLSIDLKSVPAVKPTIYIDYLYENYLKTKDFNYTMENAASAFVEAIQDRKEINTNELFNPDIVKSKIIFQLVNTEQNKEMLEDIPNRKYHDLSVTYRVVENVDRDGIVSTVINNEYADILGFSEEQLFVYAAKNTKQILPPVVKNMNDMLIELMPADGSMDFVLEEMGGLTDKEQIYVLSNKQGINGAYAMLYEENLYELAKRFDSDIYLLPSSIHEVIVVSIDMGDPDYLASMVAEINMSQLKLDERLSNQVYHYDKDLRKVTLATDTPNKRLDGIINDNQLVYSAGRVR